VVVSILSIFQLLNLGHWNGHCLDRAALPAVERKHATGHTQRVVPILLVRLCDTRCAKHTKLFDLSASGDGNSENSEQYPRISAQVNFLPRDCTARDVAIR